MDNINKNKHRRVDSERTKFKLNKFPVKSTEKNNFKSTLDLQNRPTTTSNKSNFPLNHIKLKNKLKLYKILSPRRESSKMPFILDCCKIGEAVLPNYNGLNDPFSIYYYDRPSIKKHLVNMKIVI